MDIFHNILLTIMIFSIFYAVASKLAHDLLYYDKRKPPKLFLWSVLVVSVLGGISFFGVLIIKVWS